jgi:hypothetical protein
VDEIVNILQTYSLEEILEYNDILVEDALMFLLQNDFLKLPDVRPL